MTDDLMLVWTIEEAAKATMREHVGMLGGGYGCADACPACSAERAFAEIMSPTFALTLCGFLREAWERAEKAERFEHACVSSEVVYLVQDNASLKEQRDALVKRIDEMRSKHDPTTGRFADNAKNNEG